MVQIEETIRLLQVLNEENIEIFWDVLKNCKVGE